MTVTYNLTENLIIELYLQYGIKPLGVNIVAEDKDDDMKFKPTNLNKYYKIEGCKFEDGSCNLYR